MSPPVPVAEGTLASTPFAHLLLSLQKRRLNGTLAIWPDDGRPGQDRILFRLGAPVGARLLDETDSLERGLLPLFRRTSAPYAFYEADLVSSLDGAVEGAVDPLALVAAGLRGGGRDEIVNSVLAGYRDARVRIGARFDVAAFRLIPKELSFVDLVRADPTTVGELIARSGDEKVARRMLYLVAITGNLERVAAAVSDELPMLEPSEGPPRTSMPGLPESPAAAAPAPAPAPAPPASAFATPRPVRNAAERLRSRGLAGPEPAPPPPPGLSDELRARWEDLARRADAADRQTLFDVLGVEEAAAAEAIRTAYFEIVKRVHPDRLPPEFAPLRGHAERIFQLATEAKDTLENDEKRLKYVRAVKSGGGTPEADRKMMLVLQAAHELEKAGVLANMGRWQEALAILEDVKLLDPTQLDAIALEAWALFHRIGQDESATPERIVNLCEQVLAATGSGHHERALYTKGLALKKLGKEDVALECFRRVAEKNPRHLEAAREVRLYEMRHRDSSKGTPRPATGGDGGLLSKLFGGKKP